jgi:hypothetical protein
MWKMALKTNSIISNENEKINKVLDFSHKIDSLAKLKSEMQN